PSCERMMSSIPCRTSVPGAMRSIEASRRGSRRGSSSDGVRVKPRCLSVLSGDIECGPDRSAEGLVRFDTQFATRRGSGRGDDCDEAELGALLEAAIDLGRRAQPAGEADLPEGGD